MIEMLLHLDKELFLWINSHNTLFLDYIMYGFSLKFIWVPLYLYLLFLLFKTFHSSGWWYVIFVLLTFTLTDQLSVKLFKDVFERLRPCHEPSLEGLVHLWNGNCGGKFGFISSHATNVFGLAVFMGVVFWQRYKWGVVALLLWALIVSYSRIYLGVHYPGDVLVGMLFGGMIGFFLAKMAKWLHHHYGGAKSSKAGSALKKKMPLARKK